MRMRLFALAGGVLLTQFGSAQHGAAAAPQPSEYRVRAAFLLNFTKFIEWPASEARSPGSPFTLCIVGEDPFGPTLEQVTRGEMVNGRKLAVARLAGGATNSCQIVYFGKAEKNKELLNDVGPGVLTVGEGDTFIREGGMIAFVLENRRVRFIINLNATRNSMLTVSSRLLAVAKAVKK